MSVIKAVSVSCNYSFGNASLEYICLKMAQVCCSILYWHKDNFKQVVRTLVITGLKGIPNRTKCLGWGFLFLYEKPSQDSKLNTGVLDFQFFLNLLYSAHLEKLLCERRDKMYRRNSKQWLKKSGKFH